MDPINGVAMEKSSSSTAMPDKFDAAQTSHLKQAGHADGELDLERLLDAMERSRNEGNSLFREEKYFDAYESYKIGVDAGDKVVQPMSAKIRKLAVSICCNATQALLRCNGAPDSPALALAAAKRAVLWDPTNIKALFRRGCAYSNDKDWAHAWADLRRVLTVEPNNGVAQQEVKKVEAALGGNQVDELVSRMEADQESLRDKIIEAEQAKLTGTQLFKAQRYLDACAAWKVGIDSLDDIAPEALDDEARRLKIVLCNNSAQALSKCPDMDGAASQQTRQMADMVLILDPTNVKALFRRGCALAQTQQLEHAMTAFQDVLQLEPDNDAALKEIERVQHLIQNVSTSSAELAEAPSRSEVVDPAGFKDPGYVCMLAQKEADNFREEVLQLADRNQTRAQWSQRFNKIQVLAADFAKHQLSDPEMLEDLFVLNGSVFKTMDQQQKENFLTAREFVLEAKSRYGDEIMQLLDTS